MIPQDATFERPAHALERVDISVVIPAYNEAQRIGAYLHEIQTYFLVKGWAHEVIVVNDGSRDATAQTVREHMKKMPALGLISYDFNRGKGYAVRQGMLSAQGTQRIFADADGSTPISEIEKLRAKLAGGCDIAIGSRALPESGAEAVIRPHRRVIAAGFRLLRGVLLPVNVVDSQCGFKMFTAGAAQSLFSQSKIDGMAFDVELLYLASRSGLKVAEVPVKWTDSYPSTIRLWSDPFKMARDLVRIRRLHRLKV